MAKEISTLDFSLAEIHVVIEPTQVNIPMRIIGNMSDLGEDIDTQRVKLCNFSVITCQVASAQTLEKAVKEIDVFLSPQAKATPTKG